MIITGLKILSPGISTTCVLRVKDTAAWRCDTVGLGLLGEQQAVQACSPGAGACTSQQAVRAVQACSPSSRDCISHHRSVELGM